MDQITKSYLSDFKDYFAFPENIEESVLFEHFVNYCTISKKDPEKTDIDRFNVGGKSNPGIDGAAILANEKIIFDIEEMDSIFDFLGYLEVDFIFTQAKTSPGFHMGDINNFIHSVKEFFAPQTTLNINTEMDNLITIKNHVYKNAIRLKKNPQLKLYYATLGNWNKDPNIESIKTRAISDFKALNLFSNVEINFIDITKLHTSYRELKNKISREVEFEKHVTLPKTSDVTEAYLGILPGNEILKLITDAEQQELNKTLFYDNIRDFQGFNQVNAEIQSSIEDNELKSKFVMFNNGITVVAKSIKQTGSQFIINDFQIVNGGQTCHILYYTKDSVDASIQIPFKLIVTDNSDTINQIVRATNRQTEIKNEAFETLKPFHKKLEEFYVAIGKNYDHKLYYERRSKQFDSSNVKKTNIISLAMQISSFLGMFLDEPHSTHRYYGELLSSYNQKLFQESHSLFPYYVSAFTLKSLETLFRNFSIDSNLRRFRYHIAMLVRLQISSDKMPSLDSKKIDRYCDNLLETIWNPKLFNELVQSAASRIKHELEHWSGEKRNAHRTRSFTEVLNKQLDRKRKSGTIKYYNTDRGFGFISDGEVDYFMHIYDLERSGSSPEVNMKLSFDTVNSPRGLRAINIELDDDA